MTGDDPQTQASGDTTDGPCSCALLRKAARRLTQAYDAALSPSGLTVSQFSLLSSLETGRGAGSITALADYLALERTSLTRNLRPLEAAGLIRVAAGVDQRSRAVEITAAGRRRLAEARPLWREAERDFRRTFGRERAATLRALLGAVASPAATRER